MLNKRVKAEIKKVNKENCKIKLCLGTITLMLLCVFLLISMTFIQISFPHYAISSDFLLHPIKFIQNSQSPLFAWHTYYYIPQLPIVFFIAAFLGRGYSMIAILMYLIAGLTPFCPIFALGGGFSYFLEYGFGYILAFPFATYKISKLSDNDNSFKCIVKSAFTGVILIHLIGTVYFLILCLFKHESYTFILDWIFLQTITKIFYDFIFGIITILIGKYLKKFVWIIMK